MTANAGRSRDMYLHIWGSAYSPDATTGVCTFENNTYMWNEDPLGGHSTNVPAYVRAVWGGKDMAGSKSNAGNKSKATAKKSSDDNGDTGEDKKESAKKIVKKIGKGLKTEL